MNADPEDPIPPYVPNPDVPHLPSRQEIEAANKARQPVEVRCSEWVEELAENVERKMCELYKGHCLDHDDGIVQRAATVTLGILIDALRAGAESSSTD